ncbi:Putative cell wall binding repeat 2 [Rathayibacter oskolensis]|uniref:Putative cell wall binding repeat 2 n=1 Tax=Rathayibacter oskolensis TaxID=1891671 RepID=A0A1X7NVC3_9MICO|nr:cell wall-binding repeat-containing protein [Rathayibacter oskolensis]SMH42202.1 Putative cell wall binding repeat 2 [Rathayibacter oskolensis]
MHTDRRRSRRPFLPAAGGAAAVALALLGGFSAGSPAAAAAADSIVLSGTIYVDDADEAHPEPSGEAYRVQAVNEDSVVVKQIVTGAEYSMSLPGGHSYALRAEVVDDPTWYPTWSGSTPIEEDAYRLEAGDDDLSLFLGRTAPISGDVTAAAIPGVTAPEFVVEAWWLGETEVYRLATARVRATPGVATPWSFAGAEQLPVGTYVFRIVGAGYPDYDAEYYPETNSADKYSNTFLDVDGLADIDFTPTAYDSHVERIAGGDRYATAVELTRSDYGPGYMPVLYLASGENWPDALSAGPAASHQSGALLLTDPRTLPAVVADEITRLEPDRIVVVGGPGSVSEAVRRSVDALTDAPVERIAGADRYETSRLLVEDAFEGEYDTVFLATGTAFPDALSVAPIAGSRSEPVLLVDGARGSLDEPTRRALERLSPGVGQLLGSTPSISAGIESDLTESGLVDRVDRIGGADRHDTSRLLNARYPSSLGNNRVYLASATGFADALAAGPVVSGWGARLYLSEPGCVPRATRVQLQSLYLDDVTLLGGTPTLSPAVARLTTC